MGYTERDMQLFEVMRKLDADTAELSDISGIGIFVGKRIFSADEARKQSADNIQRKIQEKLQEIEPLIKQATEEGKRKLTTDEIVCYSKEEYEFIKQVEHN